VVSSPPIKVAIVDYGMGNLFSVGHAFENVGASTTVTSSKAEILDADIVVLPGVGAFGDAMDSLRKLDLVGPIIDIAASGKPLIGVCLGMELLMTTSPEFGAYQGLDVVQGAVVPFPRESADAARFKVPHVGWSRIYRESGTEQMEEGDGTSVRPWQNPAFDGVGDREYMYFVHSLYCEPEDPAVVTSYSLYGGVEFCSSFRQGNVFGYQFHPERSGPAGLKMYANLVSMVSDDAS
jgi:glutamine amidotransferase